MSPLEPILKFRMTPDEAKAFKLCLLWEKLVPVEFPNEHFTKLSKSGDPRKCVLFKYCYKLVQETKGLIPDKDYKLYIIAQLQVLKTRNDGKVHALIDPCVLVGNGAWNRWKLWKRTFDQQMQKPKTAEEIEIRQRTSKVLYEIDRSKEFLQGQGVDCLAKVTEKIGDGSVARWIATGKVSPYYVILSPLVAKSLDGKNPEAVYIFDIINYSPSINEEVRAYFKTVFSHEFLSTRQTGES